MDPLLSIGLSILLVSLISLVGVFGLSLTELRVRNLTPFLISLAIGALLGDAFIHLIPEALESSDSPARVALVILLGIILFLVIEKFLHWHHHAHGEEAHETIHPTGRMVVISDAIHNFLDGLLIATSFLVSPSLGIATTLAVVLHEIPQEMGDYGILLHAGYSRTRALWLNFCSALAAFLGAGTALFFGSSAEVLASILVPVGAGGFIYIAMSDLVPELHKTKNPARFALQTLVVLLGIAAMALLGFLE